MNHWGQHTDCPPCFKIKLATVQFTSCKPRAFEIRKRDKAFEKDAAAYNRLKKEGIQPRGVDKSSLLESHGTHKTDALLGRPTTDAERKAFNRELGAI